ncbi:Integrator complex subunit 3, partial [Quaeritorhiza haematococci]
IMDCIPIGRDLVRVLQEVARIPEFEALLRDMMQTPQKLNPHFQGLPQLFAIPTPKWFFQYRITPDMEMKLLHIMEHVRHGNHTRNLQWLKDRFLSNLENDHLYADLVRFICGWYHPTNAVLASDVVQRYVVLGWLLVPLKFNTYGASVKLALFYDWLFYDPRVDNIMNIEPAMLLMDKSAEKYPYITTTLLDFLKHTVDEYYPPMAVEIHAHVGMAMRTILEKGVISADETIRQTMRHLFPAFLPGTDPRHPNVPPQQQPIPPIPPQQPPQLPQTRVPTAGPPVPGVAIGNAPNNDVAMLNLIASSLNVDVAAPSGQILAGAGSVMAPGPVVAISPMLQAAVPPTMAPGIGVPPQQAKAMGGVVGVPRGEAGAAIVAVAHPGAQVVDDERNRYQGIADFSGNLQRLFTELDAAPANDSACMKGLFQDALQMYLKASEAQAQIFQSAIMQLLPVSADQDVFLCDGDTINEEGQDVMATSEGSRGEGRKKDVLTPFLEALYTMYVASMSIPPLRAKLIGFLATLEATNELVGPRIFIGALG